MLRLYYEVGRFITIPVLIPPDSMLDTHFIKWALETHLDGMFQAGLIGHKKFNDLCFSIDDHNYHFRRATEM